MLYRWAHLASEGLHSSPDLSEALGVGVLDHGHHETVGSLHRDADVNVVVLPNEVAVP